MTEPTPDPATDPEAGERLRYRELLEELRTILPGVQVLFAFLLTAPFSQRFTDLDALGRHLYGIALIGTAVAMVIFLAPASYHRIAPRQQRRDRLRTGIRLLVTGMLVLAIAVVSAVAAVTRFVFGTDLAAFTVTGVATLVLLLWYLVPLAQRVGRR